MVWNILGVLFNFKHAANGNTEFEFAPYIDQPPENSTAFMRYAVDLSHVNYFLDQGRSQTQPLYSGPEDKGFASAGLFRSGWESIM